MQYFPQDRDAVKASEKMLVYASERQELDKFLTQLLSSGEVTGLNESYSILDAACGVGHLAPILLEVFKSGKYLGVDSAAPLIDCAREINQNIANVSFETVDIIDFASVSSKQFDVVVNWKTLSWLPDYKDMLQSLVKMAKKKVILSSLFYDGDIDFYIKVKEHAKIEQGVSPDSFYNVYSLSQFCSYATELGVSKIGVYPFEIKKDLYKPDQNEMGTYTERLTDGRRIQISGAVVMFWKVLVLELE